MDKFINLSIFDKLINSIKKEKKEKFFKYIEKDLKPWPLSNISKDILEWILEGKCVLNFTEASSTIYIKTYGVIGILHQINLVVKDLLIYYNGLEKYNLL